MACISSSIVSIHFSFVTTSLKLSGSLSAKKQNRVVSSMTCVATQFFTYILINLQKKSKIAKNNEKPKKIAF
jgi:hypothetical protein